MSEGFYGHAFIAPKRVIYAIFFFALHLDCFGLYYQSLSSQKESERIKG